MCRFDARAVPLALAGGDLAGRSGRSADSGAGGPRPTLRSVGNRMLVDGLLPSALLCALVACSDSKAPRVEPCGSSPAAPSCIDPCAANPAAPGCPPPPPNFVISGQVVAYGTGAPIPGAHVVPNGGATDDTDDSGTFELSSTSAPASTPIALRVEAAGYVTREAFLQYQAGTRGGVVVDLIREAPPFSQTFFKALVRNGLEEPGELAPVLRLEESPKFYVRTVDQTGRPVEPEVLDVVLPAIRKGVRDWTGNKMSVTTLETGTQTRPRTEGWIVVNITRNYDSDYCGRAFVGATAGEIELVNDRCSCGSNKISGALVSHEIGHAMGFFHVADRNALMYPFIPGNCPPGTLSASERYHSALAYARTRGNLDPDRDPPWGALSTAPGGFRTDRRVVN